MKDQTHLMSQPKGDDTWMSKTGGFARDKTLRDHYAGLAMQGFLANFEAGDNIDALPAVCWLAADAMLEARKK
jgi:hypothetical protein